MPRFTAQAPHRRVELCIAFGRELPQVGVPGHRQVDIEAQSVPPACGQYRPAPETPVVRTVLEFFQRFPDGGPGRPPEAGRRFDQLQAFHIS